MSWIENISEKNIEEWIDEFQLANLGDHRSFELLGVLIEVYRKTQNERDTYRDLCADLLKAAQGYVPHMPTISVKEGGANRHSGMLKASDNLKSAISKAESILGG